MTISVIVPTHNVAPYVTAALRSVLAQTRGDFELIVIDDGSTDGTVERAQAVADPRLRLIVQPNSGSPAARNRGLAAASGRYVCFLDGDDLWMPDKLARQSAWLDHHPETDLVFGASRMIEADGHDAGRAIVRYPGVWSFRRMLTEDVIANGSSQMVRREAVERAGRFDQRLVASVDHDLWLRIALLRARNVVGLDDVVTLYRRRPGQISSDWRRKELSWFQLLAKLERLAPQHVAAVRPAACANLYRVLSAIAYENGEYADAAHLLRRAVGYDARYLLRDRRTWLQTMAVAASLVVPPTLHARLDSAARRARAGSRRAVASR